MDHLNPVHLVFTFSMSFECTMQDSNETYQVICKWEFQKICTNAIFWSFLENENYASCAMMQKVQICTLMWFDIRNKKKKCNLSFCFSSLKFQYVRVLQCKNEIVF